MGEMSGLGLEDWMTAITEQDGRIRLGGGGGGWRQEDDCTSTRQTVGRRRVGGGGGLPE